jgi:arginine exporter protein ArgO
MNIGAAGALFAAWLAIDAIQEQLSEERERRNREQPEAKEAAVVCIAPTIHA